MPLAVQEISTTRRVLCAVSSAVREGFAGSSKSLPPWLFYDERGSRLFEQITALPEYYLTRAERALLEAHADEIFLHLGASVTIAELGAGTAAKTGILLRAATRFQPVVLYQPIDISESALDEAQTSIESIPGVIVRQQVANYVTDPVAIHRPARAKILALYIGSSIGNFAPAEASAILINLRSQMKPGDALLLGTDLAPSRHKLVASLLAAYDDAQGVTAAFNRNIMARLNRDLGMDFDLKAFRHRVLWNAEQSRIEMHLESLRPQSVRLPADAEGPARVYSFQCGETIHTENSYKFTEVAIDALLRPAGFEIARTFRDANDRFAVTLAVVVD